MRCWRAARKPPARPPRRGSTSTRWSEGRAKNMSAMTGLSAGFSDKVLSAQSTFRAVMEAMARPGSVHHVTPDVGAAPGLMHGAAALALTLFDHDTPIWLDPQLAAT